MVTGEIIDRKGADFWVIGGATALLAAAGALHIIRRRQFLALRPGYTRQPTPFIGPSRFEALGS